MSKDQPDPAESLSSITERPGLPDLALLTTILLWSSTFVVTKDQLDLISPFAFIGARFAAMVLLAFVVLRIRMGPLRSSLPSRKDLPRIVAAGLTGYTFYQLGFVFGLDKTSVFATALLIATGPLWTLVLLRLIGERSPLIAWVGVVIAIVGVAIFLWQNRGGESSLAGGLLSLGAAISFATYGIINRPLVRDYPAASYSAYTMLMGTIPLVFMSIPAVTRQDWAGLPDTSWLALAYMVVLPVYVAYMLWNFGIARRGAAIASSFGLLVPVISGILSAIIFNEQFGIAKLLGAMLVLIGLLFIRLGPTLLARKNRDEPPPLMA